MKLFYKQPILFYGDLNTNYTFDHMEKGCQECGKELKGRIDKKFCDDTCRSIFNNRQNSRTTIYIKKVNKQLRKNRSILEKFNPEGKANISKSKLIQEGFDFTHFTSTYINKEGKVYYYCYEQGYLPIEGDFYFLVVKRENN